MRKLAHTLLSAAFAAAVIHVLPSICWAQVAFYVRPNPGIGYGPPSFGIVDKFGNSYPLATLDFGADSNPITNLLFAPNGTLYAYDVAN